MDLETKKPNLHFQFADYQAFLPGKIGNKNRKTNHN